MERYQRFRLLALAASCLVLTSLSCGKDKAAGACVPGASQACVGAGDGTTTCEGVQVCTEDGAAFSACDCSPADIGSAAAGASGMGEEIVPPLRFMVGSPCQSADDCPVGVGGETLDCITVDDSETFGPGGPQGGYCTLPCTPEGSECADVDDASGCVSFVGAGAGVCMAICIAGPDGVGAKCRAPAQACVPQADDSDVGLCLPVCQSDEACGGELSCNRQGLMSLCGTEASATGVIGSSCTAETEEADCGGAFCVEIDIEAPEDESVSFCSANCALAIEDACGSRAEGAARRDATCRGGQFQGAVQGDLGYCLEICDVDADCEQADFTCRASPLIEDSEERFGVCIPRALLPDEPVPDAGGEDSGSADATAN